jgi:hypothetical protein
MNNRVMNNMNQNVDDTEVDLAQVTSLRIQLEQLKQSISQLEAERACLRTKGTLKRLDR